MLTRCVSCGGGLTASKVEGLGHCPTCNHYTIAKPIPATKYDLKYRQEYERRCASDLGRKINEGRWALVSKYLSGKDWVLDYGCGTGAFIRSSPNGFNVAGYDINPFVPYKDSPWGFRWNGVTAWDVLEHMERPDTFIRNLETRYLFAIVPDVTDAPSDLTRWKHYKPDEHQHLFSERSMRRMLERCGYRVKETDRAEARLRDAKNPQYLVAVVAERGE